MRLQRDQFTALLKAVWSRDPERTRAIALQVVARNPKDGALAVDVNRIFLREPPVSLAIPNGLDGMVRIQEPHARLDDLVLSRAVRSALELVMTEHAHAEELAGRGLWPTTRLLFHGASGTGKTSAAAALSEQLGLPLFVVPIDTVVASYLGETSKNLRRVLEFVSAQPAVVLLDELDAIGLTRGGPNEMGEQGRIVTTLLVLLDEVRRRQSRTVLIGTTNRRSEIDAALARRFDLDIEFPLAEGEDIDRVASRVFERAKVTGPSLPFDQPTAHAEIERWALAEAKRIVLGGGSPR